MNGGPNPTYIFYVLLGGWGGTLVRLMERSELRDVPALTIHPIV